MALGQRNHWDLTHRGEADGGEAPCFAHLLTDTADPLDAGETDGALLVHLDAVAAGEAGQGALWHLPHGGDLDANLVRFDAGCGVGEHVNDEVDVIIVVQRGDGLVRVGRRAWPVQPATLVMIPKGVGRAITAGPDGIEYLSIHRRRNGLTIR
jgi:quercetin dioxygenase-like cupin family protein